MIILCDSHRIILIIRLIALAKCKLIFILLTQLRCLFAHAIVPKIIILKFMSLSILIRSIAGVSFGVESYKDFAEKGVSFATSHAWQLGREPSE